VRRILAVPPKKEWPGVFYYAALPKTSEDACDGDMLVLIRWQRRTMPVPLSQLSAIDPHEVTSEAIKDWQYWVAQGHCF
jgi:hypothetical protein